jgi:hypothetical protein
MRPQHSAGPSAPRVRRAHRTERPRLSVVGRAEDPDIDERAAHFFGIVAALCGDARLGRLTLRLKLANGREIAGLAEPVRETDGSDDLAGTGYANAVTVDGVAVALSDVIEASVAYPGGG